MLKGIAASSGIVIGKVFKFEVPEIVITKHNVNKEEETKKLKDALEKTIHQIETIKEKASKNLNAEEASVFDAHLTMVNDPELMDRINLCIDGGMSCEEACKSAADEFIAMFESMDDPYFKERAADIKDVTFRLLCNILGLIIPDLSLIDSEVIICANDLTPSDTAQLNKKFTLGFITEIGGRTSHSAIMARSLEIPAIVGSKGILKEVKNGDTVIMDAINGEVIVNPSNDEITKYNGLKEEYLKNKDALKALLNESSVTLDNHKVELAANIGTPKDVEGVIKNGAEGIGLYRTEFLYMDKKDGFPTEDEQFEAYKTVLESMNGKKVVVRTLDIGGDKKLEYFKFPDEMNPFLGYRAIRLCLDKKDIFRTQIRALLRASVYGKLCIMFPMIATINEFKEAKSIVLEEKENLLKNSIKVSDSIEIGMMVEIPAAAVLAKEFAKYADFFSIGTNDLIQYSMAADRMSEKVSYLYQPLNPSILNLVKMTIDGAHSQNKWCGMCGEMAGDLNAAKFLLGLGLDEFSMSATSILSVRKLIRESKYEDAKKLADIALTKDTEEEVKKLLD